MRLLSRPLRGNTCARLARLASFSAVALLFPSLGSAQNAPAAGQIRAAMTHASLLRNSAGKLTRSDAVKGTEVTWGDVMQTDTSGRARIVLNDQSILTLGSNSTLRVVKHDASTQQTALELGYGRIRCQIAALTRASSSFELRTPSAVAGVIGTDFGADSSDPDVTRFVCVSGTVRVRNADPNVPGSVDCGPGMSTTVRVGEPPTPPEPAEPDQIARWQHITEPDDSGFADTIPSPPLNSGYSRAGEPTFPWVPDTGVAKPIHIGGFNIGGTWRARVEGWDWFNAPPANNSYAYLQSILRIDIGQRRRTFDWQIELAQPTLLGLPNDAIAPGAQGQLGLGATQFVGNGFSRNAAYIFPSQAFVRFRLLGGGEHNQLTLGRFTFVDGTETVPKSSTLAQLKQMRIAHRLIGDFGWSTTGRSEDGAALSWNLGRANVTAAIARPTRGVFRVDGLGELDIGWAYGAVTVPVGDARSAGELRVFGLGYDDTRAVLKTDNRSLLARNGDLFSDIRIGTLGAHYIHALNTQSAGTFDLLLWGAGQTGDWGVQTHRAAAGALEVGWQPDEQRWKPWLRLGYFVSSGDGNPNDNQHNTFFSVLPTPRVYARYPFFNQMNNSDASAIVLLRPSPAVTFRTEGHALWLTSRQDLWYLGGGAWEPHGFGYSGRPSGGARGLGNLWDFSADYQLSQHWGIGLYYAHLWGKGVMKSIYPNGPDSNFGYAELTLRF